MIPNWLVVCTYMNTAGASIILLDTVIRSAITVSCCLKRGREESNLMPAMGYLHIDGKGELASSGSRYNLLEAETIAALVGREPAKY